MNGPPIKKKCPECGGCGLVFSSKFGDTSCLRCDCEGEVFDYLTPEQWEAETGEKMLDSDPVWVAIHRGGHPYGPDIFDWRVCEYREKLMLEYCIVARPGQPKPPNDWRPE